MKKYITRFATLALTMSLIVACTSKAHAQAQGSPQAQKLQSN